MEKEIILQYQKGKSISQLLTDFPNFNRRQITKILTDNNITIRGGRKKKTLSQEQVNEAIEMINNGTFLCELAEHFDLDKETLRNRLKELNIKVKNTNRVNRRINSNYFSVIDSPEKAYWLGFLYTDGSVDHYGKTGRIRLQLQEQDIEILEQFKADLNLDCKIIYDVRSNSTCCSVEFVDEQIYNDLANYGIKPRKTYLVTSIPYQKIPREYWSAYALGLFDGDGSLSCSANYSTDVTLNYTAYHEQEVKDFQNLINEITGLKHKNQNFFTSAWHTQWRGRKQVLSILEVLYKNCPRYLKRKHEKYLALKASLK